MLSGKQVYFISNFLNSFFALSTFWQSLHFFFFFAYPMASFNIISLNRAANPFKYFKNLFLQVAVTSNMSCTHQLINTYLCLEYWAIAQHWPFMETSLAESTEFTCLETVSSDCSFSKCWLNLRIWSVISLLAASISVCWDSTIETRYFFQQLIQSFFSLFQLNWDTYKLQRNSYKGCQNYALSFTSTRPLTTANNLKFWN